MHITFSVHFLAFVWISHSSTMTNGVNNIKWIWSANSDDTKFLLLTCSLHLQRWTLFMSCPENSAETFSSRPKPKHKCWDEGPLGPLLYWIAALNVRQINFPKSIVTSFIPTKDFDTECANSVAYWIISIRQQFSIIIASFIGHFSLIGLVVGFAAYVILTKNLKI